jgi:regulator of replication initiation timing
MKIDLLQKIIEERDKEEIRSKNIYKSTDHARDLDRLVGAPKIGIRGGVTIDPGEEKDPVRLALALAFDDLRKCNEKMKADREIMKEDRATIKRLEKSIDKLVLIRDESTNRHRQSRQTIGEMQEHLDNAADTEEENRAEIEHLNAMLNQSRTAVEAELRKKWLSECNKEKCSFLKKEQGTIERMQKVIDSQVKEIAKLNDINKATAGQLEERIEFNKRSLGVINDEFLDYTDIPQYIEGLIARESDANSEIERLTEVNDSHTESIEKLTGVICKISEGFELGSDCTVDQVCEEVLRQRSTFFNQIDQLANKADDISNAVDGLREETERLQGVNAQLQIENNRLLTALSEQSTVDESDEEHIFQCSVACSNCKHYSNGCNADDGGGYESKETEVSDSKERTVTKPIVDESDKVYWMGKPVLSFSSDECDEKQECQDCGTCDEEITTSVEDAELTYWVTDPVCNFETVIRKDTGKNGPTVTHLHLYPLKINSSDEMELIADNAYWDDPDSSKFNGLLRIQQDGYPESSSPSRYLLQAILRGFTVDQAVQFRLWVQGSERFGKHSDQEIVQKLHRWLSAICSREEAISIQESSKYLSELLSRIQGKDSKPKVYTFKEIQLDLGGKPIMQYPTPESMEAMAGVKS